MMAFSMPEEKEKFTLSEMVEAFDLERISLGGPVFDVDKLTWLNGRYIREDLDVKAFAKRIQDWALNEDYLMKIAPLVQQRVDTLGDLGFLAAFFFANDVAPSIEDLKASTKKDDETLMRIFQFGLWRLEALKSWKSEDIQDVFKTLATEMDVKIRDVVKPYFVAISGAASSTPLFDSMEVLGPDLSRVRVRKAIDVLGGVSKKAAKRLEKEYRTL
jgi:glutamyl-tRNA synthetase